MDVNGVKDGESKPTFLTGKGPPTASTDWIERLETPMGWKINLRDSEQLRMKIRSVKTIPGQDNDIPN